MEIIINSDGGSRGNPGPAGFGYVIKTDNKKIKTIEGNGFIGTATNNQAEYQGVIAAMEKTVSLIKDLNYTEKVHIKVLLDSLLIVEQMNGKYKIKNEGLKPLFWRIRELILEINGNVVFSHIPREKNSEADELVNDAIDKATK